MNRSLFQPVSHGKKSPLWSARVRLDAWPKIKTFHLRVTDKRVASQMLEKLVQDLEREEAGIVAPRVMRDAAQTSIAEHLKAYLADLEVKGCAKNTLRKYSLCIPKLCERCGWKMVRDVTVQSFCTWRASSGLKPKTLNVILGAMCSLLNWMERQQLILANPLKHTGKSKNDTGSNFRRALSVEEIERLLVVAPKQRAIVYFTALYTGLRRAELSGLKWSDFDFTASPPLLRVPSSLSKNKKSTTHELRAELADALKAFQAVSKDREWAFRGTVPKVSTMKKDLKAAGVAFVDASGRRMDFHALRHTFVTLMHASNVPPRVAMALARHSDLKLTMRVYTDTERLGLDRAMSLLPSFGMPKYGAQNAAQVGAVSGDVPSSAVASGRLIELLQKADVDASRRKKTASVATSRFVEMVGTERFELSTSCSRSKRSTRLSYVPISTPVWPEKSGQETAKAGA